MLRCTSSYSNGTMTRTESITLPSGTGEWPVAKMTCNVTPAAGEVFGRIGDLIALVYRDHPRRGGHVWVAPCAVNCARHGRISSERTEWHAWRAGREHLAAEHLAYDPSGNVPSDQCETPASDYYAGLPAI